MVGSEVAGSGKAEGLQVERDSADLTNTLRTG
jgi:hypothetical protein